MGARALLGLETKIVATSKQTLATPSTVAFDFGTPNDIYLPGKANYDSGDRLLFVCTASTAGTTSTLTWVFQDADDTDGGTTIGTPATVDATRIDSTGSTLAGSTGDDFRLVGVSPTQLRPWIRVSITHATATDSFVAHCTVLAIPPAL